MSQPGLFDPTTGELGDPEDCAGCRSERARFEAVQHDLALCERDLRQARAHVAALKTELAKQLDEHPEARKARAIFSYWVTRCDKKRKVTKFGEKRKKAVLARLSDGYDATYIVRAIDGLATSAWHRENGQDELELVCRNEVNLERFHGLAERIGAESMVGPAWLQEIEGELPEVSGPLSRS